MNKVYRSSVRGIALLMLSYCWPMLLQAQQFQQPQQEERELAPVSRTYAITNATVVQGPGRKMEKATVVVKDGLITAVGKNISIPPEAIIIKGDSLHIYAGFIDGLSRTGVIKPKEEPNRERPKDPGNPTPEAAGITPQNDVRVALNPADKSVEEMRALGFTAAQVVPYGNMLPGQAAIIFLNGKSADAMVLSGKSSLFSELAGAQRVYPSTVIAVMSKWRELYRQALQAKNYETVYSSNRAGLNRPATDRILEAFYPVIDRRMPVLFEADRYLETQRIMALQADLGFTLMMGDLKEGWDAIPKIKATGTKVFLSLDLPEDKKEDKKDSKDKKDTKPGEPKKEEPKKEEVKKEEKSTSMTPAEKEALEKRKAEFTALYTGQAAAFQKAGIPFGFSSLSVKTSDIRANLRRMIAAGLTEDQALAALTTGPAQLLGLSDRLGSIDNGKIANLVLSDKPYFNEKSKVRYVFVDGVLYRFDAKETPKADADAKVEVLGTWTVTADVPQGKNVETLVIKKDGNNYSGSISGGRLTQSVPLDYIELNGNALKYSYTVPLGGQTIKAEVDATVEGNTFKGTVTAGSYGSFPLEGKKDPNR
jgi:imidazolonepropionase-like amidohydrolase